MSFERLLSEIESIDLGVGATGGAFRGVGVIMPGPSDGASGLGLVSCGDTGGDSVTGCFGMAGCASGCCTAACCSAPWCTSRDVDSRSDSSDTARGCFANAADCCTVGGIGVERRPMIESFRPGNASVRSLGSECA